MNRTVVAAIALIVLAGGMITALTQARSRTTPPAQVPDLASTATIAATPASLQGGIDSPIQPRPGLATDNATVLEARVVPVLSYDLRFAMSGTVAEVLVDEGATVAKGDIIARYDTRALDLDIRAAEAELLVAQADYKRLLAGASPAEIAQSESRVARARAGLGLTSASISQGDIAATQAQIDALKVKLAALEAQPSPQDIAVAKANLDEAKLKLESNRATFSAQKTTLEAKLEVAANGLRDAQDIYRRIKQENEGKTDPSQDEKDAEARALRAMQNAEQTLRVAQVELDEARQVEKVALQAAEGAVRAAQARYDLVVASKPLDEIAETKARIAQAQALLNKQRDEFREAQIAVGQAEIDVAEADLDRVKEPTRPADLGVAEARVRAAEIHLQQRRFAQEQYILRAPMAGTLARLNLAPGQVITSDQLVGVLADTSSWQIYAAQLSEVAAVNLQEGDKVSISFYALPDLQLTGTITRVLSIGEVVRNQDTTYALIITPDTNDSRLRWNMTATVRILPGN